MNPAAAVPDPEVVFAESPDISTTETLVAITAEFPETSSVMMLTAGTMMLVCHARLDCKLQ